MGTFSISNNFIENQCVEAANDLLNVVLDIKSRQSKVSKEKLLTNTRVVELIEKIDTWTNWVIRERKFICELCSGNHGRNYMCEQNYSNSGQYDTEVV